MKTFWYRESHSQVSDLLKLQIQSFFFIIHPSTLQEHALLSWRESTKHGLINSSQFSICETTPWVLCLVFRLSSKERQRHTGANPGQWHQEFQRAGAPNIQGKVARWVCSAWRRDAPTLRKQTFPSKAHCEMVMQQWTQQHPLQIPGSYQEKAFHSGNRSSHWNRASPQQCPEQSDVIWHRIWY